MKKREAVTYCFWRNRNVELIVSTDSSISYPMHVHVDNTILGMVTKGEILLIQDSAQTVLKSNDVFLIPPYSAHSISSEGRYSLVSFCIKPSRKPSLNGAPIRQCLQSFPDLVKCSELTPQQTALLNTSLRSLFHHRNVPQNSFRDLVQEIVEKPASNMSLDDMASFSGFSKYHFMRRFKKEVGITPHQFIAQRRVRKAQQLLCSNASLANIAAQSGFFDQSHFTKTFSSMVGLTPKEYRESLKFVED